MPEKNRKRNRCKGNRPDFARACRNALRPLRRVRRKMGSRSGQTVEQNEAPEPKNAVLPRHAGGKNRIVLWGLINTKQKVDCNKTHVFTKSFVAVPFCVALFFNPYCAGACTRKNMNCRVVADCRGCFVAPVVFLGGKSCVNAARGCLCV